MSTTAQEVMEENIIGSLSTYRTHVSANSWVASAIMQLLKVMLEELLVNSTADSSSKMNITAAGYAIQRFIGEPYEEIACSHDNWRAGRYRFERLPI